ncbi:MAG: HEPN domain-containing protein [bacterium]|nr:HEPN domain-containing protein [bacterium]
MINNIAQFRLNKKINKLPFEVIAVVLFGSWAKGANEEHSDCDLLIVANKIHPRKNRRGSEIATIKRIFSLGLPSDILLLTPMECISNFKNHNPLFLDICEEGFIIFDKENFIKSLIKETKNYISTKGIERLDNGWKFPVAMHTPSYLSAVSQKDFAKVMLKDGERDYQIGEKLIEEHFFDKAVYHFQQAVEKAIKSVLICFGIFKKTHFVGEILLKELENIEMEEKWKDKLKDIAIICEEIEPEVTWSRYPGIDNDALWIPYEEYTKEDAAIVAHKAKKVTDISKNFYKYWFKM